MKEIAFILAVLAAPAFADVVSPGGKVIDCYCTDQNGERVELGQTICLEVGGRRFTARCEMSLNNPMWREQQEGCVSSSLIERFQHLDPTAQPLGVNPKI